jgi:uncharacterized membrane protein
MDNFRKKIVDRVLLLAAGIVITIGAVICLGINGIFDYSSGHLENVVSNLHLILFAILVAILFFYITKNIRAIRNPDHLNKLRIDEADERNLFIKQKTGSIGMNIVLFGLTIATIVIGKRNPQAFFALLSALIFVIAVRLFLRLYYRNRY